MDLLPRLSAGARTRLGRASRRVRPHRATGGNVERDVPFHVPLEGGGPLALDVYRPSGGSGPRPVVIGVHGGGFAAGSKTWMAKVSGALAGAGYLTLAVDYRLGPAYRYPLPVEDVCAAVEWARRHAPAYGGDGTRLALLGSSAGAVLSLHAASRGYNEVRAVVSWSGIWDQTRVPLDPGPSPETLMEAGYNFVGCRICPEVWAKVAVAAHATAAMPPVLLVNGERELVPASQVGFAARDLERLGVAHEVLLVPGRAHGLGLARRALGPSIAFLQRHLGT